MSRTEVRMLVPIEERIRKRETGVFEKPDVVTIVQCRVCSSRAAQQDPVRCLGMRMSLQWPRRDEAIVHGVRRV